MDEAMRKSGEWPNVAIEAGSDPADVMERYGVKPGVFDIPEWGPARIDGGSNEQWLTTARNGR